MCSVHKHARGTPNASPPPSVGHYARDLRHPVLPSADPSSGGETSSDSSASPHLQVYASPSGWQPPIAGACAHTHTHTSACTGSIIRVNICQHCCCRRHVHSSHRNTGRAGVCLSLAASKLEALRASQTPQLEEEEEEEDLNFFLFNKSGGCAVSSPTRSFKHAFWFF